MDQQNEELTENMTENIVEEMDKTSDAEMPEEIFEKKDYDGLKFSTQITGDDMVNFVMHHSYSSPQGWFGVILSIAAIVYLIIGFNHFDNMMRIALVVIGLLFTVINPLMLYMKAKKQVKKNKMFQRPMDFILNDEYLVVEQDEEQLAVPWAEMYLVKENKRSLIIYVTRMRAFIWPKEQLGANLEQIENTLVEKMGSARVRLKPSK